MLQMNVICTLVFIKLFSRSRTALYIWAPTVHTIAYIPNIMNLKIAFVRKKNILVHVCLQLEESNDVRTHVLGIENCSEHLLMQFSNCVLFSKTFDESNLENIKKYHHRLKKTQVLWVFVKYSRRIEYLIIYKTHGQMVHWSWCIFGAVGNDSEFK